MAAPQVWPACMLSWRISGWTSLQVLTERALVETHQLLQLRLTEMRRVDRDDASTSCGRPRRARARNASRRHPGFAGSRPAGPAHRLHSAQGKPSGAGSDPAAPNRSGFAGSTGADAAARVRSLSTAAANVNAARVLERSSWVPLWASPPLRQPSKPIQNARSPANLPGPAFHEARARCNLTQPACVRQVLQSRASIMPDQPSFTSPDHHRPPREAPGVRGVREDRRAVGPLAEVPAVRHDPVLRPITQPARQQATPGERHPVIASAEARKRWLYCYRTTVRQD